MATFTRQQMLALALTSAGSQRALARELGVSHQKVGRWLREGQPLSIDADGNIPTNKDGSAKVYGEIPEYIDDSLTWVFQRHKEVTRQQAEADGVPYNATVPVYTERKYLGNKKTIGLWYEKELFAKREARDKFGPDWKLNHQIEFSERYGYRVRKVGDRVISGPTEFIDSELRPKWVRGMIASQAFYKVNIRSTVDLKKYSIEKAKTEIKEGRRKNMTPAKLARDMLASWVSREARESKRIVDRAEPFPFYTQSYDARPGTDPRHASQMIEEILQEKHSPAVGAKGTAFADEYLLQLLPATYDSNNRKPAGRSRAASKRAKSHPRK